MINEHKLIIKTRKVKKKTKNKSKYLFVLQIYK
jgi:hypothetical protein